MHWYNSIKTYILDIVYLCVYVSLFFISYIFFQVTGEHQRSFIEELGGHKATSVERG